MLEAPTLLVNSDCTFVVSFLRSSYREPSLKLGAHVLCIQKVYVNFEAQQTI